MPPPIHTTPPQPSVILRHELPDGTSHFDWLIARDDAPGGADDRTLIAYRLADRPDEAGRREFEAVRLPDHRVMYLTYEGPVSGGRGRVERVAHGVAVVIREGEGEIEVELALAGEARVWVGRRDERDPDVAPPLGSWKFRSK